MADLTSNQSTVFSEMFGNIDELPNIAFRNDIANLSTVFDDLEETLLIRSAAANPQSMNDSANIVGQVIEQYDGMKQCPEHQVYFRKLTEFANQLGTGIINTFNILKNSVKPEADTLIEAVNNKANEILRAGNVVDLTSKEQEVQLNTDFTVVDWDNYLNKLGGADFVKEAYKEITGDTGAGTIDEVSFALRKGTCNLPPLPLNEATAADIKARLFKKIGREEQVDYLYNLITDKYTFDKLVGDTLGKLATTNAYGPVILDCMKILDDIYPNVRVFSSTPFDVTDQVNADLKRNTEIVLNFIQLVGFALIALRNYFTGAYLIDTQLINGDQKDAYTGTMDDLSKFVVIEYTTTGAMIPTQGIRAENILQDQANVNVRFDSLVNSTKLKAVALHNSAEVQALKEVLTQYLKDTDVTRLPEGVTVEQFAAMHEHLVSKSVRHLHADDDHSLEGIIYHFIIELWYDDTMVETTHKLFGRTMAEYLQANPDMNTADLVMIDAKVAATIAAKFLAEHVLKVC